MDDLFEALNTAALFFYENDIIHVLGESGNHKITPRIQMVLDGEYDAEVKEAAREALEKVENRKE